MQRNDMIKKMVDCYRTCKVMRYSDDQAMDRVLELMEEQGVTPPLRERTQEEIDNPRFDGINMGKYIRDWSHNNE